MKFKTTTHIATIAVVNFYCGEGSPSYMFESDIEELNDNLQYEEDFNMKKYMKDFIPFIQDGIDGLKDILREVGVVSVKVTDIEQPREYNFSSDWAELEVKVADDWRNKVIEKIPEWRLNKRTEKMYKSVYKSRDGFMSFCPESWEEYIKAVHESNDDERVIAMAMAINVYHHGVNPNENFSFACSSFKTEHEYEEYAKIGSYIHESLIELLGITTPISDKRDAIHWALYDIHGWAWRHEKAPFLNRSPRDYEKLLIWATNKGYTMKDFDAMIK